MSSSRKILTAFALCAAGGYIAQDLGGKEYMFDHESKIIKDDPPNITKLQYSYATYSSSYTTLFDQKRGHWFAYHCKDYPELEIAINHQKKSPTPSKKININEVEAKFIADLVNHSLKEDETINSRTNHHKWSTAILCGLVGGLFANFVYSVIEYADEKCNRKLRR